VIERAALKLQHVEPMPTRSQDIRQSRLLALLRSGHSGTAAASELGIDVGTAIAWAAKEGISTARRPKVLKNPLLSELIADLRAGVGKAEVAQKHGVSVQAVTRLLRSEVGLHDAWHAARFQQDQERARCAWLDLIASAPGVGVTALRLQQPWAYAWLYRNDRAWLGEQTRSIRLPRTSGAVGRVNWDARDTVISNEVLRVASDIATGSPNSRVALWQLYQAIPELKAKIGALDRLPLTRAALENVTRPRRRRTKSPRLL
jgi:Tn7-like transposition protein D